MNHLETIIRRYQSIEIVDVMATYFLIVTDISGNVSYFPSKELYDECKHQDDDHEVYVTFTNINELNPSVHHPTDFFNTNVVPCVLVYDFIIQRYIGHPEFDRLYHKHKLLYGSTSDSPSMDLLINTGDEDADQFILGFLHLYDDIRLWADFPYQNISYPMLEVMRNIDSENTFINDMIEILALVIEPSKK